MGLHDHVDGAGFAFEAEFYSLYAHCADVAAVKWLRKGGCEG